METKMKVISRFVIICAASIPLPLTAAHAQRAELGDVS